MTDDEQQSLSDWKNLRVSFTALMRKKWERLCDLETKIHAVNEAQNSLRTLEEAARAALDLLAYMRASGPAPDMTLAMVEKSLAEALARIKVKVA